MKVSMKFLITLALTAGSIYLVFVLNEEGPFRILFNLLTFAGIYGCLLYTYTANETRGKIVCRILL